MRCMSFFFCFGYNICNESVEETTSFALAQRDGEEPLGDGEVDICHLTGK